MVFMNHRVLHGRNGFAVAMELKVNYPDFYKILCEQRVTYGRFNSYYGVPYDFTCTGPIIETCSDGFPRLIRYQESHRRYLAIPYDKIEAWEEAYQKWIELTYDPRFQRRWKTCAGDLMVFMNHRVLHGRNGAETKGRILVGGSIEVDVVRGAFIGEMKRRNPHLPDMWTHGSPEDVVARMQHREPCYMLADFQ